eukprot:1536672-Rhodomonas_salina.1
MDMRRHKSAFSPSTVTTHTRTAPATGTRPRESHKTRAEVTHDIGKVTFEEETWVSLLAVDNLVDTAAPR